MCESVFGWKFIGLTLFGLALSGVNCLEMGVFCLNGGLVALFS